MPPLSNKAFIREFIAQNSGANQRPFCWILGSGASSASGIPLGRELAQRWLQEIYDNQIHSRPKPDLKEWANRNLKPRIPSFDFDRASNFYPELYRERFAKHREQGFIYLQDLMMKAKPSLGYKVLAQIMSSKPCRHNVAITTNFDNLIAGAISQYTEDVPFVCGHEYLARYIIENLHRPLVAQIHRNLFLAPKSNPDEIEYLAEDWKLPLSIIFERFTPIVIGFGDSGGSGGSLMKFLEELRVITGGIYWCYVEDESGGLPAKEIQSIVERHGGHFVPILGFDELMFQLWDAMKLTSIHVELQKRSEVLVANYRNAFTETAAKVLSNLNPT
jgi:hypothetical protein